MNREELAKVIIACTDLWSTPLTKNEGLYMADAALESLAETVKREREADHAAIREANAVMGFWTDTQAWREKHAAAIQRATEAS